MTKYLILRRSHDRVYSCIDRISSVCSNVYYRYSWRGQTSLGAFKKKVYNYKNFVGVLYE